MNGKAALRGWMPRFAASWSLICSHKGRSAHYQCWEILRLVVTQDFNSRMPGVGSTHTLNSKRSHFLSYTVAFHRTWQFTYCKETYILLIPLTTTQSNEVSRHSFNPTRL